MRIFLHGSILVKALYALTHLHLKSIWKLSLSRFHVNTPLDTERWETLPRMIQNLSAVCDKDSDSGSWPPSLWALWTIVLDCISGLLGLELRQQSRMTNSGDAVLGSFRRCLGTPEMHWLDRISYAVVEAWQSTAL